jgi:hypothetical protein
MDDLWNPILNVDLRCGVGGLAVPSLEYRIKWKEFVRDQGGWFVTRYHLVV